MALSHPEPWSLPRGLAALTGTGVALPAALETGPQPCLALRRLVYHPGKLSSWDSLAPSRGPALPREHSKAEGKGEHGSMAVLGCLWHRGCGGAGARRCRDTACLGEQEKRMPAAGPAWPWISLQSPLGAKP